MPLNTQVRKPIKSYLTPILVADAFDGVGMDVIKFPK